MPAFTCRSSVSTNYGNGYTNSPEDLLGEINKYDFRNDEHYVFKARKGLDRQIVEEISDMKNEPAWMRDFRLKSLDIFNSKPMPHWGGNIGINFQDVYYYHQADRKPEQTPGKTCRPTSRTPSTGWAFRRPRRSISPA